MEIAFLSHYGFEPRVIEALRARYGSAFLPLQERAIREYGLFENRNLLVRAPTSSGKTMLAELLFLRHVQRAGSAVLLAPSKALANQFYEDLAARYKPLGYQIRLSTRDHSDEDAEIREGSFHLLIAIYEKIRTLMAGNPGWLRFASACVADEIHHLLDPERGPEIEWLLTRLRRRGGLQLAGLSAMPPPPGLAEWLNASVLEETRRAAELRRGVLCGDRFVYREHNSGAPGEETIGGDGGGMDDPGDEAARMLRAALWLRGRGESALLFFPRRGQCRHAARLLAESLPPAAPELAARLDALEPGTMNRLLREWLPRGVAVHTSDLTAGERRLVETLVREGGVQLVCATGTLAEGINLPVRNVLTMKQVYEGGADEGPRPITSARLINMTGRAGRRPGDGFGRGMVVTAWEGEIAGLMGLHEASVPPSDTTALPAADFGQTVLRALESAERPDAAACAAFLRSTWTGFRNRWPPNLEEETASALRRLCGEGFAAAEDGRYWLTPLGTAVIRHGLSTRSARVLGRETAPGAGRLQHELDALCLVGSLDEMNGVRMPLRSAEMASHIWTRQLSRIAEEGGFGAGSLTREWLSSPVSLGRGRHLAVKKALMIWRWTGLAPMRELEETFQLFAGAIARLTGDAAWLLSCALDIANASSLEETPEKSLLRGLIPRTRHGLPQKNLAWGPLVARGVLSRTEAARLIREGCGSPPAVEGEPLASLPAEKARIEINRLLREGEPPAGAETPVLELDEGRPHRIALNGKAIALTPIQSKLMRCLARRANRCVTYEELLNEIWGSGLGDRKRVNTQKNRIMAKAAEAAGKGGAGLIETAPGVGFILRARLTRPGGAE